MLKSSVKLYHSLGQYLFKSTSTQNARESPPPPPISCFMSNASLSHKKTQNPKQYGLLLKKKINGIFTACRDWMLL